MAANKEIWIDIKGFEGYYKVSTKGRVKSLPRIIPLKSLKGVKSQRGGIMMGCNKRNDYTTVTLSKEGKAKNYRVHRLVAEAFIPNPNSLPQVNHLNGMPYDNRVENLEWCTNIENTHHAWKLIKSTNRKTKRDKFSRPIRQLTLDGELVNVWNSAAEAGRNGFKGRYIRNCCFDSSTYRGYKWEFAA